MVKIRLRRVGAKKQPSYRIVVADSHSPRNGSFIENLGHYNPLTDPPTVVVNVEKAKVWISKGAQPTEAVARLLAKQGVEGIFKPRMAAPKKGKAPETAAAPAAAAQPEPPKESKAQA
ncbi:MAG: 30S ribosomal protein S16 [Dehalococcoidia bacterium]|nr:30S ribosomal protein S16 [Dehalococcoidia bacterium]